jgi:hypothetical protein
MPASTFWISERYPHWSVISACPMASLLPHRHRARHRIDGTGELLKQAITWPFERCGLYVWQINHFEPEAAFTACQRME